MSVRIMVGDVREQLKLLPDESVHCVVTSPPYFGLRSYLPKDHPSKHLEIGAEKTPGAFVETMVEVFREVRRVLRKDGTLFINIGDSYWSGGAQRAGAYGTSDREPEGSPRHGCFCRSLCDACRAAYRIGRVHSGHPLDPMPPSSSSLSSRVRKEGRTDRSPKSDSADQGARNSSATLDRRPSRRRVDGLPPASRVSKPGVSAQLLPASSLLVETPDAECRLCGCSLQDCGPASARMAACICGKEAGALGDHTTDMDAADSAYPYSTMPSLKEKNLIGIPWRVAFALQADGWYLRQDIIWSKPNPMPESVTDRCTKAHEYVFMFSKRARYYFDAESIAENRTQDEDASGFRGGCYVGGNVDNRTLGKRQAVGNIKRGVPPRHSAYPSSDQSGLDLVGRGGKRNKRSVWEIATSPYPEAHYATFPPALAEPCILAGCPKGGTVLDCFGGAGTTGLVADRLERNAILIDLDPASADLARNRIKNDAPLFTTVS
jgi:DNA modification methylase